MSNETEFWNNGPNPNWKHREGANDEEWKKHKKIEIDPYGEGRTGLQNYKLLSSAVTPRPIGFISTIKANGIPNLAPFSYFNIISVDPPLFVVSFSGTSNKDTLDAILTNKELTINIISEWFVEAANFTAIVAPPEANEWEISGLTPAPSAKVKPAHVAESAFSVEATLVDYKSYESKLTPGVRTNTVVTVEAVQFHVREDMIDEERTFVDTGKLKPIGRLGKNSYTTVNNGYDLARFRYFEEFPEEKK